MNTCPNGHASAASDYCDTCGSPMSAPSEPPAWAGSSGAAAGGVGAAGGDGTSGASGTSDAAGDPAGLAGDVATQVCPHCGARSSPSYLFCEDCGYDFTTGALPRPLTEGLAAVDTRVPARPLTTSPDGAMAPKPQVTNGNESSGSQPFPDVPADLPATPGVPADPPATPDVPPAPAAARPAQPAPLDPPATPATGPRPTNQAPSRRAVGDWVVEVWIDPAWFEVQSSDEACPSPAVPDIVRISGRALVGRHSASRRVAPDVDCGADSGVSRRHAEFTTDGRRWWVEDLGSSNGTYVGPASGPLPDDAIPPGQRVEIDDDDRIYVGAWTRLVLRRATDSEVAGTG